MLQYVNRFLDLLERYVVTQEKLVEVVDKPAVSAPAPKAEPTVVTPSEVQDAVADSREDIPDAAPPRSRRGDLMEKCDELGIEYTKNQRTATLEKMIEEKEAEIENPPAPELKEPEGHDEPEGEADTEVEAEPEVEADEFEASSVDESTPAPTRQDVKDACMVAAKSVSANQDEQKAFIRGILERFEAAKLSDLQEDQYAAVIALCSETANG